MCCGCEGRPMAASGSLAASSTTCSAISDSFNGDTMRNERSSDSAFAREAERPPDGMVSEFWHFMRHNKKWWLTPIILVLLLLGVLIVLGGSAAAPFIYTLF